MARDFPTRHDKSSLNCRPGRLPLDTSTSMISVAAEAVALEGITVPAVYVCSLLTSFSQSLIHMAPGRMRPVLKVLISEEHKMKWVLEYSTNTLILARRRAARSFWLGPLARSQSKYGVRYLR